MEGFDVSGHLTQSINMTVEKCHQEGSCSLIPHLPRAEIPLQWLGEVSIRQRKAFDLMASLPQSIFQVVKITYLK